MRVKVRAGVGVGVRVMACTCAYLVFRRVPLDDQHADRGGEGKRVRVAAGAQLHHLKWGGCGNV